jgi:uncharacterized membrane protein HdeD (DUF308 family)
MNQSLAGLPGIETLKKHWWALLLRGIVAVLFGVICFFATGIALVSLIWVIGFYFILDGILMLAGAFSSSSASDRAHWWWLIIGGIAGIAAGIFTFIWPGITALTLAILVAAWAIVTGAFELATAIRMRKVIPNDWLWVLNGVLSVVLGVLIFINPGAGLIALVYLLGFYALLAGFTMIGLSIRLRSLVHPPA